MATPLGNLGDITLRALDVLRRAAVVAAEDTRHTRRLLSHYHIQTEMIALHEHNESTGALAVAERLGRGEAVAYVTDAGTPGISDPGVLLVRRIREAGWPVVPVPGPSALITALSAAGVEAAQFVFYGFLPAKAGARQKTLAEAAQLAHTAVFYEAPHRLQETLADMAAAFGGEREITIARELTKMFEEVRRASLTELAAHYAAQAEVRGEIVLVIAPPGEAAAPPGEALDAALRQAMAGASVKDAAAEIAARFGLKRRDVYARALELKRKGEP